MERVGDKGVGEDYGIREINRTVFGKWDGGQPGYSGTFELEWESDKNSKDRGLRVRQGRHKGRGDIFFILSGGRR